MKLRRIIRIVLASLFAATLVVGACGKDKPAEEAPVPTPELVEGDKPAEEPTAEGEKPAEKVAGKTAEGETVDEARENKRRSARDRMNGRRPALRQNRDPKVAEGEGSDGNEVPNPGEPIKVGEGIEHPATPTPGPNDPPTQAEPPTHPIGEPTPPAPNPTPAEVTPTPVEVAAPVVPEPVVEVQASALSIDGASIMPANTVAEITGMQLVAGTPLQGIAIVPGYGSVFYAMQEAAKFGVALQVWQDSSKRECDDRYRRMRLQYPNAEDVTVLQPSKAFYSYFDKLQTLTWLEPTKRMVVSVTCGETVCNQDQLVRLAKSARDRLP